MGRPKGSKNKSTIEIIKSDITKPIEQPVKSNKKLDKILICELCGNEVKDSLANINLIAITGKATWHRECKVDRLNICNDCCKELNNLIDNFIIKKNASLKKWS